VTTVQNVEKASGMNLLTALPAGTRKALEAKRDSEAQGSASSNPCQ
jgi:hypothetical protein